MNWQKFFWCCPLCGRVVSCPNPTYWLPNTWCTCRSTTEAYVMQLMLPVGHSWQPGLREVETGIERYWREEKEKNERVQPD